MKKIWIYDLEQFPNLHTGTFKEKESGEIKFFQIGCNVNDFKDYMKFLKEEVIGLVGFNNLNYDYPLLHFMLIRSQRLSNLTTNELVSILFDKGQEIIHSEYSAIKKPLIPQLDLYRIWHFDNKARVMSLKAVEIALNMPNVQDLPYAFDQWILPDQVSVIRDYNLNDVNATEEFYKFSEGRINLRKELTKSFNLPLMNANDPKIGEQIFAKLLSQKLGISTYELRKLRTPRTSINLGEIILPYINFQTDNFKKLHDTLKSKIIHETKNSMNYKVLYKNVILNYGLGGLHACCVPGVYSTDDIYMIVDVDVTSFYPNISIQNDFYPEHLGKAFCSIYQEIFNKRKTIPKSNPTNYAYKLMLNGTYGKSNEETSFFYDPKFTMSITVNGQLLLTMLVESVCEFISDIFIIQVNTDGVTFKIKRSDYNLLVSICKNWENLTHLSLEYAKYEKMIVRDVNNYSAKYFEGSIKHKGAFEINKEIHKDQSMKIVRIALEKYYFEGIAIEETIRNHTNIYDFCKRYKATKGWTPTYEFIDNGKKTTKILSKNVRYFVSNGGKASLLKVHDDGRRIQVESGKSVKVFNNFYPSDNYGIDYNYYIKETYKLIYAVDDGQQTLF